MAAISFATYPHNDCFAVALRICLNRRRTHAPKYIVRHVENFMIGNFCDEIPQKSDL